MGRIRCEEKGGRAVAQVLQGAPLIRGEVQGFLHPEGEDRERAGGREEERVEVGVGVAEEASGKDEEGVRNRLAPKNAEVVGLSRFRHRLISSNEYG